MGRAEEAGSGNHGLTGKFSKLSPQILVSESLKWALAGQFWGTTLGQNGS